MDFSLIVKDFPVVLWCQQTIKKRRCQDCTTFERFPLCAATTVTPVWTGPWLDWTLTQLDSERAGFTDVLPIVAPSLDVPGPGQPRLDSGSPPAGWFPLPDADVGLLACHPSASWQSVFDDP